MLPAVVLAVALSVSSLHASKIVESSEFSDERFKEMESKFQFLLAKTRTEMKNGFNALLEDNIALKNRLEKVETIVDTLRENNSMLENQVRELQSDDPCCRKMQQESKASEPTLISEPGSETVLNGNLTSGIDTQGEEPTPIAGHVKQKKSEKRFLVTQQPGARYKYAFYARLSEHLTNPVPNKVIAFGDVITNDGEAYSQTTSKFTCEVTGTYFFTVTMLSLPNKFIETEIVKNDISQAITYSRNTDHYNTGSHSAIIRCKQGDRVWVRVHGNFHDMGLVAHAQYCSFSGFILWTD